MIPINAFQTGQGLETANHEGSTFIGVNTGVNIEEGVQGETIVFCAVTSAIFLAKTTQ